MNKILPSLFMMMVISLVSCSDSKAELRKAVDVANKELAGQFLGDGCYCDGVALEGDDVIYTYSFPGQEVGENAVDDDEFAALMKPALESLMGELKNDPEGKAFLDAVSSNDCGMKVVMKFTDRSYSVDFSADEVKAFGN